MAPRKLYPMPVGELIPAARALPNIAAGMLFRLCLNFWERGCVPLSPTDMRLTVRGHEHTWRKHKPAVLQAFNDWRPTAEAYKLERDRKGSLIRAVSAMGGAATQSRARLKSVQDLAPPAPSPTTPIREPAKPPRPASPNDRPARARLTDAA